MHLSQTLTSQLYHLIFRMYRIARTVTGYDSSVNVLEFTNSRKQSYLLSGDDWGIVRVFSLSPWSEYRRYVSVSAVLCALWHPRTPGAIVVGTAGGAIHVIKFNRYQVWTSASLTS